MLSALHDNAFLTGSKDTKKASTRHHSTVKGKKESMNTEREENNTPRKKHSCGTAFAMLAMSERFHLLQLTDHSFL
jgi:hypothetical protein